MAKEDLITVENFGKYADIDNTKRILTAEEIASSKYAQFYDFPVTNPTEEQIIALLPGNEMDVEKSLLPSEYWKRFHPEIPLCENGYCVRPEGFGYSVITVKFPEVTWDMFLWFTRFYTANPVQYSIWLPKFHEVASMTISDEDLGWGVMKFDKNPGPEHATPQMFGVENPTELDPDFLMLTGGCINIFEMDESDKDTPVKLYMLNYLRRCGEGIEIIVDAWMGIHYIDGQIVRENPTSPIPLVERTRLMACHNAWEWSRCATVLPELYKYAVEIGDVPPKQS